MEVAIKVGEEVWEIEITFAYAPPTTHRATTALTTARTSLTNPPPPPRSRTFLGPPHWLSHAAAPNPSH
jgi:hypothetical protein